MFECLITVEGNGSGKYGRFKEDRTAPVSKFMVDNTFLYPRVKKHVVSCPKCDPTEALLHYLNRRLTMEKFKPRPGASWPIEGVVTGSLCKMALGYERGCAKVGRPISRDLVNEFIWRTADATTITRYESRLSVRELVCGARLALGGHSGGRINARWTSGSGKFAQVLILLTHNMVPKSEQELENLIQVAEVALS